ncbi:hypothetical protein F3Y22_tig00111008pilonHSYRG00074 [Hibiscus syriacus]|uniref:Uncharacterized protein n=1 Tax=Hibiscus syriacus TaxID=106335 RepID=A0A6A2Z839_HIBSY|nr:hypothetical protein F3Y22_tig00111008pilonHSYRG00074 [Hibiscus syriacus]
MRRLQQEIRLTENTAEPDLLGAVGAASLAPPDSVVGATAVGDGCTPTISSQFLKTKDRFDLWGHTWRRSRYGRNGDIATEGKVEALVRFRVTPSEALLLNASHKHRRRFESQSSSQYSTSFRFRYLTPARHEGQALRHVEDQSRAVPGGGRGDGVAAAVMLWAASTAQMERMER